MKGDNDSAVESGQEPQGVTAQPGPGHRLAKARSAANMTVEEVAISLNLTLGVVQALERDAIDELPAPVFVRGYIKNYARLVGLRGDELVAQYEGMRAPDVPLELRPRTSAAPRLRRGLSARAVLLVLIVVGAALVGLWWVQNGQPGMAELTRALRPEAAPVPAPLPAEGEPRSSERTAATGSGSSSVAADRNGTPIDAPGPAGGAEESPATTAAAVPAPVESVPVETAPAAAAAPVEPPPPPVTGHRLNLRLSDDVWVEILDSEGQRLVFDMLRAGASREVTGEPPFLVLLGKAGAVAVELDGRAVDHTAFERKGIARFVLDDDNGNIVTREP